MKIQQIRNATIIVEYNGTKFLIDPWLGPKDYMPGFDTAVHGDVRQPRVELPFEIEKIVDVNAVILTHFHPDHWDQYAADSLNKGIKFFVQSEIDKKIIGDLGFTNIEIISPEGTQYKGITLFKTFTQHGEREKLAPMMSQVGLPYDAMGIVFRTEGEKTLYVAGDTIYCQEVQEALDKYKPDVIVVNACAATVLTGDRLIMNYDDIANVIKHAPNAIIVASHMDTVSHLTITRKDLKAFIEREHITNVLIPDDGETLDFPPAK